MTTTGRIWWSISWFEYQDNEVDEGSEKISGKE